MVLNKFAFLTRQGLGKTLTHVPQTFVAGTQSSYASSASPFAPFGNHSTGKFGKVGNAHLHTSFQGSSNSAAFESKAAQANGNNGDRNDSGLAAYYDAWQKQHQLGREEKEWKQFQFVKRIGWKAPTAAVLAGRAKEREELSALSDTRLDHGLLNRAQSTSAVDDIKKSDNYKSEAEALASVDKAVAEEIEQIKGSKKVGKHVSQDRDAASAGISMLRPNTTADSTNKITTQLDFLATSDSANVQPEESSNVPISSLCDTMTIIAPDSLETVESISFDKQITALQEAGRYAEILPIFKLILAKGLRPSTDAYNALLAAVMHLEFPMGEHQRISKALLVYTNMLQHGVKPDADFYDTIIQMLADRALYSSTTMHTMDQQHVRFRGLTENSCSLFKSKETEFEILAEDNALASAIKLFDQSTEMGHDRFLSPTMYQRLLTACASYGKLEEMMRIYVQMETHKIAPIAAMFPPMIEAFGACGDLRSMVVLYNGYRELAIANNNGAVSMYGRQDDDVYAAVVKGYLRTGRLPGAEKFLGRILDSYQSADHREEKIKATQHAVFVNAFIQHHVDTGNFVDALKVLDQQAVTGSARDGAFANITVAAADSNDETLAKTAYGKIRQAKSDNIDAAAAMLALQIRNNNIEHARGFWAVMLASPQLDASFIEPATMYAIALVRNGFIDEGLTQARKAFSRIRATATGRFDIRMEIDEAIEVIGSFMAKQGVSASGPAIMCFLRAMKENGGLVSPTAEQLMAGLGYAETMSIGLEDLTLALQVQAEMLANGAPMLDIGHAERFAHLMALVTVGRLVPDQTTIELVDRAAHQLSSQRPDLLVQWEHYQQLLITPRYTPESYKPQANTTVVANGQFEDSFDPYELTTDFQGSHKVLVGLENPKYGSMNALEEAITRVYNMRRVGRHPRYIVYNKIIAAAAKEKRLDIAHEVLAMAQQDIPMNAQYPMVRHGWSQILDAMISACLTLGKRPMAEQFHRQLLQDTGFPPSANSIGLYIITLKEATNTFDEASAAVQIFHEAQAQGVEPSSFLYNALIGKLARARRIDDCLHHFTQMRKLCIKPTSVTYGSVINACVRVSDERMAEQLFEEMELQSNYKPRAAPYNCIIQFFVENKHDGVKALRYYERMKSLHIQPTMHTYKLLIDVYATLEPVNFAAAENVLQSIRASGQKPEAVHYSTLIHAKGCNLKDMDGAKQIFDEVMSKREVAPHPCLYQALFESMKVNHNFAAAEPLLKDMASNGIEMTPYIANALIHGWSNEKNIIKARAVYDNQVKREPSTYEAMIRAYLANDNRAGAIEVVNHMKAKHYPAAVENKILDLLG